MLQSTNNLKTYNDISNDENRMVKMYMTVIWLRDVCLYDRHVRLFKVKMDDNYRIIVYIKKKKCFY